MLAQAQPGQTYEVSVVKNDKGYNDWVSMQQAGAVQQAQGPKAGTPVPKSNYETAEERARRQVLITRQSSLSAAIATLSVGAQILKKEEVLSLAEEYNKWVHKVGGDSGFDDLPDFLPELGEPNVE